ncbi:MAG: type II secretion system F family protein [Patescibacteria group bacterium]
MPSYFYKAKAKSGETKSGLLQAGNTSQLASKLKKRGLVIIEAVLEKDKKKKMEMNISLPFLNSVSLTDKMMMTRNLKVMVSAGLPLSRSLTILANQTRNSKLKKALIDIEKEISKGNSFSDTLTKYPDIFSDLFCSMVSVGEESGTMESVLEMLALQLEKDHELKSKIQGAMIYPAVIMVAMVGIGILMLVTVVPQIANTFKELGVELPAMTQFIMSLGTFLAAKWYLLVIGLILFVISIIAFWKTKEGRRFFDLMFLKLPIISPVVKKTNAAVTVRTLSSLIGAGVPIVRSIEIVAGVVSNVFFKEAMNEAVQRVREGVDLSSVLGDYENLYPNNVIQMLKVGEETGETSKILSKLADYFEEEVGNATENMAAMIEPVLMIFIGIVVGFFAVSMIEPMYSVLDSI